MPGGDRISGSGLEVLSAVAELHDEGEGAPRQKEITEKVPSTKGMVSQKCSSLVEMGLLREVNDGYVISDENLLSLYQEHVEEYLNLETNLNLFEGTVENHNLVRRRLKEEFRRVRDENRRDSFSIIRSIIRSCLVESRRMRGVSDINDVFLSVDRSVRSVASRIVTGDEFTGIEEDEVRVVFMLAVALNRDHSKLENLADEYPYLKRYLPGEPPEDLMIEYLIQDAKKEAKK